MLAHVPRQPGSWLTWDVRQKMPCHCSSLPVAFYADKAPSGFLKLLDEKATSPKWKTLSVCPVCGAQWAVDVWDKYQEQLVTRVADPEKWDDDSEEIRKGLLLRSRGGLTEEKCVWAGCEKKKVRGVALCIDHLYATGARK